MWLFKNKNLYSYLSDTFCQSGCVYKKLFKWIPIILITNCCFLYGFCAFIIEKQFIFCVVFNDILLYTEIITYIENLKRTEETERCKNLTQFDTFHQVGLLSLWVPVDWQIFCGNGRHIGTPVVGLDWYLRPLQFSPTVLFLWYGLVRWIWYPKYAIRDLHHPVTSNFYVTTGIATVIIATNLYNIWSQWLPEYSVYVICMILWIISCIVVLFCTFYITYRLFRAEESFAPQLVNFAWLMAPIANMAVLLIGCPVFSMSLVYQPALSLTLFTVNAAFFGIGFFPLFLY